MSASPHPVSNNLRSIVAMVIAVGCFALMDAVLKALSACYPVLQIATLRALTVVQPALVAVALVSPHLLATHNQRDWATWLPTLAVIASACWATLAGGARRSMADGSLAVLFAAACVGTMSAEVVGLGVKIEMTDVAMIAGFSAV